MISSAQQGVCIQYSVVWTMISAEVLITNSCFESCLIQLIWHISLGGSFHQNWFLFSCCLILLTWWISPGSNNQQLFWLLSHPTDLTDYSLRALSVLQGGPLFLPPPNFPMCQNGENNRVLNWPPSEITRVQNLPPPKIGRVQNFGEFRGGKFWTLPLF